MQEGSHQKARPSDTFPESRQILCKAESRKLRTQKALEPPAFRANCYGNGANLTALRSKGGHRKSAGRENIGLRYHSQRVCPADLSTASSYQSPINIPFH